MTTGIVASSAIVPASSGINSHVYDALGGPQVYPFGGVAASDELAGAGTFHLLAIPAFSPSGYRAHSFSDDYYYRVQINPGALALGALTNNLSRSVSVWNAHIYSPAITLTSLVGTGTQGITETGPALPTTYTPNLAVTYTIGVSTEGPAVIQASYDFGFSNGENPILNITGLRIVAWTVLPDWAQPVKERLAWQTDVLKGWTGVEMRRATRTAPRRSFSFMTQASQQERRIMETVLFAWSAQVWALPIFPDGQRITAPISAAAVSISCVTNDRDFAAGGLGLLMTDPVTFELVQIETVSSGLLSLLNGTQNAWPAGAMLFPVRQARLLSMPKIARESGSWATVTPDFTIVEPCDWTPASGLATYRTAPVLEDSPDSESGQDANYTREAVIIDNTTGYPEVDDRAGIGFPHFSHAWFMQGAAARTAFRALMYLLKGRQGEVWVPSYQSDVVVQANIGSGATVVTIQNIGYATYLQGAQNRQDVRIELYSGAVYYRRITGASTLSSAQENISIDSALPLAVAPTDVRRISFMTLCRLSGDVVDIDHLTALDGLATTTTAFQAVNHNL